MKFSDLRQQDWEHNREYFDTALLPVTGLTGLENPPETITALERLRDVMDKIEIPYKGRIVTYPALHYYEENEAFAAFADSVCAKLKERSFKHVFLISADLQPDKLAVKAADLVIAGDMIQSNAFKSEIERIWSSGPK